MLCQSALYVHLLFRRSPGSHPLASQCCMPAAVTRVGAVLCEVSDLSECQCSVLHSCNLLLQGLRAHGHVVNLGRWSAVTQAIVVDPDHDTLVGASDPRKDGAPAGY